MCFFKSLTGYTDYSGYVVKRDSAYTHITLMAILSPAVQFSSTDNPHRPFSSTTSSRCNILFGPRLKIVNYHNEVLEDI